MEIWAAEIKELEKLYKSIKGQLPGLEKELDRLLVTDDENMALVYSRRCLEVIVTDLCETELGRPRGTEPLKGIIEKLNKEGKVPHNIIISMLNLNSVSAMGAHPKDFNLRQVKPVILDLITVIEWYVEYAGIQTADPALPEETKSEEPVRDETGPPKKEPGAHKQESPKPASRRPKSRKLLLYGVLIIIAAIVIGGSLYLRKQSIKNLALNETLPALLDEIGQESPIETTPYWKTFHTALGLERYLKEEDDYKIFMNKATGRITINTIPEKARVFAKPYSNPDTAWYFVGESPIEKYPFPKGLYRFKIEKSGYEIQEDIILNVWGIRADYRLFKQQAIPEGMTYVTRKLRESDNLPGLQRTHISDFWIDRYEITNLQFKAFLDSGGYSNPVYWKEAFIEEGDTVSTEYALEQFKDLTGWPGPANWEMGEYPRGDGDLPVTGISWYEASAYAEFANKELPTIFHWMYLSVANAAPQIVKFGNFDKKGPAEKGSNKSLTRFGTYDLPGNVSEWIFNMEGNGRMVVGGNYQEPSYQYNLRHSISPWLRSELIGFRCIRTTSDTLKEELSQSFPALRTEINSIKTISDEVFKAYLNLFEYDKIALDPVQISESESENWIQEVVSVEVPYEDAPLSLHMYLPKNVRPPYQTVVFFPGAGSRSSASEADMIERGRLDFLLKSGRAVIWPVYYSTYGRGTVKPENVHSEKQIYNHILIDVQIACDYLETRNDIDLDRIAYYGISWGGAVSPYILALEKRIKLGMLCLFGVAYINLDKEYDRMHYLPRIEVPLLMLGGQYDYVFTKQSQQTFYDLLGTPESDKKWLMFESTHYIPRKDLINETLDWLDQYFGPVIN